MKKLITRLVPTLPALPALLALPLAAQAHDGHGALDAIHWHATDVGFVLVALLVVAAVILGRRK